MTDPTDFQIYFKDNIEEIITDYTADSPYECGASSPLNASLSPRLDSRLWFVCVCV